ncbi:unnamed protein product, partial [Gulo gulo]
WGAPAALTRIPQHLRLRPVALLQLCYPIFLPDVSHAFPEFPAPDLGGVLLQESISLHDVKALQLLYRRHCEATLDVVVNLQFHYIEKLWLSFWNSKASSSDGPASLPASDGEPEGAVLPKDKLVSLCKCEPILKWMRDCDHILYQALVEILIPDVLRPVPSTLTQAIRNFAKSLEGWLTNAMRDFPQQVIQTKVTARLCPDPAQVHVPQPPGTGGARRAAEHLPDQPDAQ